MWKNEFYYLLGVIMGCSCAVAQEEEPAALFRHHYITQDLPDAERSHYGTPVLADFDQDGNIDICFKIWKKLSTNANQGKIHAGYLENLTIP